VGDMSGSRSGSEGSAEIGHGDDVEEKRVS
jgi:hypothetical protein